MESEKPGDGQKHSFHLFYRQDIDGLQALTILAVVVFHAFPSVLRGGFVAVDWHWTFYAQKVIFRLPDEKIFEE